MDLCTARSLHHKLDLGQAWGEYHIYI